MVAHNATFDIGFFNAELKRVGKPPIDNNRVVDTLAIARRKFPGAKNNLDALCSRFGISNSHRTLHGALLDSELLTEVYIELIGGKQGGFNLLGDGEEKTSSSNTNTAGNAAVFSPQKQRDSPLSFQLSENEKAAHDELVEKMGGKAVWNKWRQLGS